MVAIIITLIFCVALIAYFVWLISTGKLKKGDLNVDMKKVAQILDRDINEALNIRDNIDHCPKCGSHNLKLYRKGYNYKVGFFGSIFGVRGAGYAAGIDSNKACCRCMNCGNDWETDYDYRLL